MRKLEDALAQLADDPEGALIFAGGTDLMVQHHAGRPLQKKHLIDVSRIEALSGIHDLGHSLVIGAATTYSQIRDHATVAREFPMLIAAAKATGALAIQNRGTIGGNIANASPAADTPPALLAYDAKVVVGSRRGEREIAYCDFHKGYKKIDLAKDELILRVVVPMRHHKQVDYYEKVGARAAQAISKVGIAATARRESEKLFGVRIAYSSVAPLPHRCVKTESILEGQQLSKDLIDRALRQLENEISPISDIRSDAVYRKQVALNLLRHFFTMV